METREDKIMIKLEFIYSSKTTLFGHILKKSSHSLFGCMSFLLVHIRFTPGEGPHGKNHLP
jgi:hypothetical protein